jgi:tetratricopeptide (TPR) repeat protein
MGGIFISHTHSDRPIADALATMVEQLFGNRVTVSYSSKKELDGGIKPGDDWFRWIVDQVREADVAFILLTPASTQKPWVIWEAGAVAGAAFATKVAEARVFPITIGIKASEVPTPFARTQVLTGTEKSDVDKLVEELFSRFNKDFAPREMRRFGALQDSAVRDFLKSINFILLKLPLAITEAAVQEWLGRLDELEKADRFSEAGVMENWLDVAFGRDAEDKQRPLDLRVHRRLGELYAGAGRASDAARQFELARQLAPRDIFLLRRLGKAYLDQNDGKRTETVLAEIEELDRDAYLHNGENAALKARWCEQSGNLNGARDVLAAAFEKIPSAYYVGDLLGQVLVDLAQIEKAKDVYAQVRRILSKLREHNMWSHATALSAAIVCGDDIGVQQSLKSLREAKPSRGDIDSIERGVSKLLDALHRDKSILDELHGMEKQA